jgi:hypothetical protein
MKNARLPILLLIALLTALLWAGTSLAAAPTGDAVDPPTVRNLKAQHKALVLHYRMFVKRQRRLLSQQSDLADQIESLQDDDPGILGRMKLERLLAENLELSNRLNEIAHELSANEKARELKRAAIYGAYTTEMETAARRLRQAADRKQAANLADHFYELRQQRERWRGAATPETDFSRLIVDEDPNDGPKELLAKADILSDVVTKIRGAIRVIDGRIKRLQRERKLGDDFDTMVKEMSLFEEGARFLRRPEDGAGGDDEDQPTTETDESNLHVPPLDPTQAGAPGSDRAERSLSAEIKRLKEEKKVLKKLADDLNARAKALRDKARALRSRLRLGPKEAQSAPMV